MRARSGRLAGLRTLRRLSQAVVLVLLVLLPVEWLFEMDPFAALVTILSSHRLYHGMILCLVVIALTLALGRVFCGWVCPLGTLQAFSAWIFKPRTAALTARRARPPRGRWIKYVLLFVAMGAALAGSAIGGILDPIAITVRGLVLSALPSLSHGLQRIADGLSEIPALWGVATGVSFVARIVDPSGRLAELPRYQGAWLFGSALIAIIAIAAFSPRWWCRVLCPLGALLGLLCRVSLLGLSKKKERCTHCGKCLAGCHGACGPDGDSPWQKSECLVCLNCEPDCPETVLRFGLTRTPIDMDPKPIDLSRRRILAGAVLGIATPSVLRAGHASGVDIRASADRIRPPGSLSEAEFLARCLRCGSCMETCPHNALHPALLEAGPEGFWTPVVIPRIGPCEASCTQCSSACPSGALRPLTPAERKGAKGFRPVKIGTAFIDRGRCLPWAMETPCAVCEEFCPVSPKAIYLETAMTTGVRSEAIAIKRPYVDPDKCIGCGACENACPVHDRAAIRVSAVGETRSRANVLLLDRIQSVK